MDFGIRRTAQEVVTAINRAGPRDLDQATAEVLAAARRVDAVLSVHSNIIARAQAATARCR